MLCPYFFSYKELDSMIHYSNQSFAYTHNSFFYSFSLPLGKTPKLVKSNSLPTPDVYQSNIAEENAAKLTGLISDSKSQNSNETPTLPCASVTFS